MSEVIIERITQQSNMDKTEEFENKKAFLDHLREQKGVNKEILNSADNALAKKIEEEIKRLKKS